VTLFCHYSQCSTFYHYHCYSGVHWEHYAYISFCWWCCWPVVVIHWWLLLLFLEAIDGGDLPLFYGDLHSHWPEPFVKAGGNCWSLWWRWWRPVLVHCCHCDSSDAVIFFSVAILCILLVFCSFCYYQWLSVLLFIDDVYSVQYILHLFLIYSTLFSDTILFDTVLLKLRCLFCSLTILLPLCISGSFSLFSMTAVGLMQWKWYMLLWCLLEVERWYPASEFLFSWNVAGPLWRCPMPDGGLFSVFSVHWYSFLLTDCYSNHSMIPWCWRCWWRIKTGAKAWLATFCYANQCSAASLCRHVSVWRQ